MGVEDISAVNKAPLRVLLIKSRPNDPGNNQANHPLGLMCLAAYLREKYHCQVKIEDIRLKGKDRRNLEAAIRLFAPHVVGISALTFESDAIPWIAESVKHVNATTPVLLGGPHATAYSEKAALIPNIDYVVVGEGEAVTGKLIEHFMGLRNISDIKGIVYKDGARIICTEREELVEDINALPMPAYDLIPIELYGRFNRMSRTGSGKFMSIFSSRGCPYHCIYCHNIFGKMFRFRSAERLFMEIKHLYDTYQIRDFEILDDIFNLDRNRLMDFCDRIINSGMKITLAFPNGMRGDILDAQQLSRLKQAGTIFIAFAIETGSPRMQRLIKKNIQLDKIKKNIEIAHMYKIHSHGFFMIGFPGETLEEMKLTVEFMVSSRLHSSALFVVMPFEGTELGEIAKKTGRVPVSDFSMNYHTENFVNLTDVPSREINRLRRQALLRFYLDPVRLFVFVRDFPNKRELGKLILLFFRRLCRWE
jgi:anaerobic magnesium-protoporphyrin IX monomethyl ester cyclase